MAEMVHQGVTVVLVHGAFSDGGGWAAVANRLQQAGTAVRVVANPLRGLSGDAAYITRVARQIPGPVLLVGHAYGGAVISQMGGELPNVRGRVFIASVGLEPGQSLAAATSAFPETLLNRTLESVPDTQGGDTDMLIQPARFGEVMAADLPQHHQNVLAVSQRSIAAAAFAQVVDAQPGWTSLPSWVLVTTEDRAIDPAAQRAAARRMGATVTEVAASHAVLLSQPETVTVFILKALATLH